jgi:hypothetical protein
MKQTILLLLICATTVCGQRNSRIDAAVPPPGSPGTVTLSLAEYNRLEELAARKPKTSEEPPQPFVISRAAFKLRVEDQSLAGTVELEGSVLANGPTKVPLTSGLTILEAKQAGHDLPLLQDGPVHTAILNGPGTFSISLSLASALTIEPGRASFVVPVPLAGSTLMSLDLPGKHANVKVEPGLITSRTTANGRTAIEATLEPGKPARVFWTTREVAAPVSQRELRFLADVKSLVSIGEAVLRVTALCDLNVVQGEASEFRVSLPAGFELVDVNGSSLESTEVQGNTLVLKVLEPARRNHQFLIAFERSGRDTKLNTPFVSFAGAQRETGELLVEGVGTMELTATEGGGLRRMDVREAGAVARSLSRFPLQAAFRYNRRPGDTPKLDLEWTRFQDKPGLSAVAERGTITTLANVEGNTLTEVMLRVRNHAQTFVRVELPAGAVMVSAEVEGQTVKPVIGPDGNRVPLTRPGLDASRPYSVSFVFSTAGARFAKSGTYEMAIPKLDIPISFMTWEVSLPDRVEVKRFDGNAMAAELFPQSVSFDGVDDSVYVEQPAGPGVDLDDLGPGEVGGIVVDPNGAIVPNAQVTVENMQTGTKLSTQTSNEGRWLISGAQSGPVQVTVAAPGFKDKVHYLALSGSRSGQIGTTLEVGAVTESVTVTAGDNKNNNNTNTNFRAIQELRLNPGVQINAPSQNVANLQRRVAGILPVKVDVPASGKAYRFVRPLVIDEETRISFQYKSK